MVMPIFAGVPVKEKSGEESRPSRIQSNVPAIEKGEGKMPGRRKISVVFFLFEPNG